MEITFIAIKCIIKKLHKQAGKWPDQSSEVLIINNEELKMPP